MTRRFALALVTALLVTLAGCSSETAAPESPSGTATSTTPTAVVVVEPSSGAAPSQATSSSFVAPTPSVIDVPTPTSANPWPADLTPEQVADVQAAIAAYRGFWQMVDVAAAEPGKDWTEEVSRFTANPAKDILLQTFAKLTARGQYSAGVTGIDPLATSVDGSGVKISDCVDKTNTDSFNSSGTSVKAPDGPGSYYRHPSFVQMAHLQDGRWVVVASAEDWSRTC
jgi:hypothetical protein